MNQSSSCFKMRRVKTTLFNAPSKLFSDHKLKPISNIDFSITMKNNSTFFNPFSKNVEKEIEDEEKEKLMMIFQKDSSNEDSIEFPSEIFKDDKIEEAENDKYDPESEDLKENNLNDELNKLSIINNVQKKVIPKKDEDVDGSISSRNSNYQMRKLTIISINNDYIPKEFKTLKLLFFANNFFIFSFYLLSGIFIFYNFTKIDDTFVINQNIKQFPVNILRSSKNIFLCYLAVKNDGLIITNKTKLLNDIDKDIKSLNIQIEYLTSHLSDIPQLFEDKMIFHFDRNNSIETNFIKSSLNFLGKLKEYVFLLKNEKNPILLRNSSNFYSIIKNFDSIAQKIDLIEFLANKEKELIKDLKIEIILFAISGCVIAIIIISIEIFYLKNGYEEINRILNLVTLINADEISNLMNYVDITSQLYMNIIDQDEMYKILAKCVNKIEKLKKVKDSKRKIKNGKFIKIPIFKLIYGKLLILLIISLSFFFILFVSDIFNADLNDISNLTKIVNNLNYIDGSANLISTLDFYSKNKINYHVLNVEKDKLIIKMKKLESTERELKELNEIQIDFKQPIINLVLKENLCIHEKSFSSIECENLLSGNLRFGFICFFYFYLFKLNR